jgi:hypothetical protein
MMYSAASCPLSLTNLQAGTGTTDCYGLAIKMGPVDQVWHKLRIVGSVEHQQPTANLPYYWPNQHSISNLGPRTNPLKIVASFTHNNHLPLLSPAVHSAGASNTAVWHRKQHISLA